MRLLGNLEQDYNKYVLWHRACLSYVNKKHFFMAIYVDIFAYDDHAESRNSHRFQVSYLYFHHTFCSENCGLGVSCFQLTIYPSQQRIIHIFGRYATLVLTHKLVKFRGLIDLGWNNVAQHIITDNYMILLYPRLYQTSLFGCTYHAGWSSLTYTYNSSLWTTLFWCYH